MVMQSEWVTILRSVPRRRLLFVLGWIASLFGWSAVILTTPEWHEAGTFRTTVEGGPIFLSGVMVLTGIFLVGWFWDEYRSNAQVDR